MLYLVLRLTLIELLSQRSQTSTILSFLVNCQGKLPKFTLLFAEPFWLVRRGRNKATIYKRSKLENTVLLTPSEYLLRRGCANAICFMPGNPFGLRHLTAVASIRQSLSAVTPLGETPRPYCLTNALPPLCRGTRPPQWLTVHRNGSMRDF